MDMQSLILYLMPKILRNIQSKKQLHNKMPKRKLLVSSQQINAIK